MSDNLINSLYKVIEAQKIAISHRDQRISNQKVSIREYAEYLIDRFGEDAVANRKIPNDLHGRIQELYMYNRRSNKHVVGIQVLYRDSIDFDDLVSWFTNREYRVLNIEEIPESRAVQIYIKNESRNIFRTLNVPRGWVLMLVQEGDDDPDFHALPSKELEDFGWVLSDPSKIIALDKE